MASRTKSRNHPQTDTYLNLIRRFPLKPIRNNDEHEEAVAIIGELMGQKLGSGASDYLDTLIMVVNKYEDEHHSPGGIDFSSPRQALRAIMDANGLSQADIGRIIGSESSVSMFLKGRRELSKSNIKALASHFKVDAGLFL